MNSLEGVGEANGLQAAQRLIADAKHSRNRERVDHALPWAPPAAGRDCSGLANPAIERTHDFESDLDHSRLSDECRRAEVDQVLRAVKVKRAAT